MYFIAHRGNIFGPDPTRENSPSYIKDAIARGFDVEVDVWWKQGQYYLGHDEPTYQVPLSFFEENKSKLWCHAKSVYTLSRLLMEVPDVHVFSHDVDHVVLTSKVIPWVYPGQPIDSLSICVMPERTKDAYTFQQLKDCKGICSDYVGWYRQQFQANHRVGVIIGGRWNCHQDDIIPQVQSFLEKNPTWWLDLHIAVNDDPCSKKIYMADKWMDAPFIASFTCTPSYVPQEHRNHLKNGCTNICNTISMFYTNMKAFEQLVDYKCKYDLVMKYRSDIVSQSLPDIPSFLGSPDNVVHTPSCFTWGGANDQIAIGNLAAMKEYCDAYKIVDHQLKHNTHYMIHPETNLMHHLQNKNIRIGTFLYSYSLDDRRKPHTP